MAIKLMCKNVWVSATVGKHMLLRILLLRGGMKLMHVTYWQNCLLLTVPVVPYIVHVFKLSPWSFLFCFWAFTRRVDEVGDDVSELLFGSVSIVWIRLADDVSELGSVSIVWKRLAGDVSELPVGSVSIVWMRLADDVSKLSRFRFNRVNDVGWRRFGA